MGDYAKNLVKKKSEKKEKLKV